MAASVSSRPKPLDAPVMNQTRSATARHRGSAVDHGGEQPREATIELRPPEGDELPGPRLALGDHAGPGQDLEVVAARGLRDRKFQLPAGELAGRFAARQLTDDLKT